MKESVAKKRTKIRQGNRMHEQLPRNLDEKLVDIEQGYRWLKSGDIKGETEITIVVAEDQAIVQTILRIEFGRKKLTVNAGNVNDMKKLLTT